MPTVSVIIPSYNCAVYLPKAIQSVLDQSYADLEIIVVDDGSRDDTSDVVAPYLDRIRYIRQANTGLPGARNTGIRASSGQFLALLDADDAWVPEKLALQMPFFEDPEVGIVYSDFSVEYADGRTLGSYLADRPLASEGDVTEAYIRSRFLFPSTMVLRRSAVDECGLFDVEMTAAEDIELFTRICLRWKVRRAPGVLMIRTEGSNNITANGSKMSSYTILAFQKILEREPEMPATLRATILKELAQQLWWRGYARFQTAEKRAARKDLLEAMKLDPARRGKCLALWLASFLPEPVLRRSKRA